MRGGGVMNMHYVDPNMNSGRFSEPEELEDDYSEVLYENAEKRRQMMKQVWE